MATTASNAFNVRITAPSVGTFSMPTVDDERNTYTLWGWTWNEATANPVYDSAGSYTVVDPDIHGDTEGDDVWAYLQAYNRRTTGRNGYLQRAQAWVDYYVHRFEGSSEYANDQGFEYDHFYGWGLQQYAQQFGDPGAAAEALNILGAVHGYYSTKNGGTWPVAGVSDMAHYGLRGKARNLHMAVAMADATGDARAIELRDKFIDLWLASPDWVDLPAGAGMYWVSQEQTATYVPSLNYAAGDRAVSSFHVGQLAEAFFAAWLSPNVSITRKAGLRSKIIAMATYMRANGLDPTYRYCTGVLGLRGNGTPWWSYSLTQPVTFWDGVYTISIVNLLVMGYKFTGDRTFLDGAAANGLYPAQYCFNRGTKNVYGSPTAREFPDNVAGNFVDTRFDSSTGNQFLAYNKGALQYTYLIFENGGNPTVF